MHLPITAALSPLEVSIPDSSVVEQETWLSFFKKLDAGWTCVDGEALLHFLLSLTACRFKNLHRLFVVAQKRSQKRTLSFDPAAHDLPGVGLDPAALAAWRDEYQHFLRGLGAVEKLLLHALQRGITLAVIANMLGITIRRAERKLTRMRQEWAAGDAP